MTTKKQSSYRANKAQSPNRSKKLVGITLAILIVAVAGGLALHKHLHDNSVAKLAKANSANKVDYTPATPADNTANENRKSSPPTSTLNSTTSTNTSPNTGTASFTVQLNPSVNNGNVHVGNQVTGLTSGDCTLTASKTGQTTVQLATATVRQDVNTYDCGVFNVPTTQFPSSGDWQLTLSVTANGTTASKSATITIPSGS